MHTTPTPYHLLHHGAIDGVTGSCHELRLADGSSVLIDCGLFQGEEAPPPGESPHTIDFPIERLRALLVTHIHIDHIGRLPYLLAAGFKGPIYCSEASAALLPLVLEDALRVGFTRDKKLIERVVAQIGSQLQPLPYNQWQTLPATDPPLKIRLQVAGHILGSAYIELELEQQGAPQRLLFSGDLGSPDTPLLPDPTPSEGADLVVLESTYGDRNHEPRSSRQQRLRQIAEHALSNRGTILIPAFSIGRTQELLYELEQIIHHHGDQEAAPGLPWDDIEIILDSPLAADFTQGYRRLRDHWDREAKSRVAAGRHPLAFEQLLTIGDHSTHLQTVDYLTRTARPAIVIAASGMCAGGRIVNYLKAMLGDPRHDILFTGYQARGTPGRAIQQYGPRGGWVELEGKRYPIRAAIHTLGGYSAHADQAGLIRFITTMPNRPRQVVLVHGDNQAKQQLAGKLSEAGIEKVTIP